MSEFDRKQYWLDKQASPADKRAQRIGKRMRNIVAVHPTVDWSTKQPSKKAIFKNTKRARKHITYAS
ncbi:MAG: hypothetical protein ACREBW_05455 [Candidatus Micrarchaeaceae archaeon]